MPGTFRYCSWAQQHHQGTWLLPRFPCILSEGLVILQLIGDRGRVTPHASCQAELIQEARIFPRVVIGQKMVTWPPLTVNLGKQRRRTAGYRAGLALELGIYCFPVKFCWQGRKKGRLLRMSKCGKMFQSEETARAKTQR